MKLPSASSLLDNIEITDKRITDKSESIKRSRESATNQTSMLMLNIIFLEPRKQAKTPSKLFKPPQLSRPNVVTEDSTQWSSN